MTQLLDVKEVARLLGIGRTKLNGSYQEAEPETEQWSTVRRFQFAHSGVFLGNPNSCWVSPAPAMPLAGVHFLRRAKSNATHQRPLEGSRLVVSKTL